MASVKEVSSKSSSENTYNFIDILLSADSLLK